MDCAWTTKCTIEMCWMYNKAANRIFIMIHTGLKIIFIMIHTGLKRMELAMPVYTNNEETKKK